MNLAILIMSLFLGPVAGAVAYHDAKTPIASKLRTAEWALVPPQMRMVAQFSAGVESARFLQTIQGGVGEILSHYRDEHGALTSRSGLIQDLMLLADQEGLAQSGPLRGTLLDVGSEARARLIVDMQTSQAYGFANWKQGQDPDMLDAFPAQRLVRIRASKVPRNWESRWQLAGEKVGWVGASRSEMVALKNSPIWAALSRFGMPWPPYDFNSGMWVEDEDRATAQDLGLLQPDEQVQPMDRPFDGGLSASVADLGPEYRDLLAGMFGPKVEFDGDTIKWKGNTDDNAANADDQRPQAPEVFAGVAAAFGAVRPQNFAEAGREGLAEAYRGVSARYSAQISAVACGRKPSFHEELGPLATPELARGLQAALPQGVVCQVLDGHLYVYDPSLVSRFLDPELPLFPQIVAATQADQNGLLLGYGANLGDPGLARVIILDPAGNGEYGFFAPADQAHLYANARALDFTLATGRRYSSVIE